MHRFRVLTLCVSLAAASNVMFSAGKGDAVALMADAVDDEALVSHAGLRSGIRGFPRRP